MEIVIGKGIYYDPHTPGDKHYFGGYLNLAQDNIDNTFKAFAERFGIKYANPLQVIDQAFKPNLLLADYDSRVSFLQQFFPVVGYINLDLNDERLIQHTQIDSWMARLKYFKNYLSLLIKAVSNLRNFYTHLHHDPLTFDEKFYTLVDDLISLVAKDVMRNKMKTDKTKQTLSKTLDRELAILCEEQKAFLEKRKKQGKRVSLLPEDILAGVYNSAFKNIIDKDKNGDYFLKEAYRSNIADDKKGGGAAISKSGLLFIVGCFLHKRESEALRSRVKNFKGKTISEGTSFENNSLRFMATHWVFGHLAFKGLRQKLGTGFRAETLLLQIADELGKVPDEVYRVLSADEQEKFVEDYNEYEKDNIDEDADIDSTVVHPVIRKRYDDKFPYFAVRFLDEKANFPSLRFQVRVGNYVHESRSKDFGEYVTHRIIKEPINLFGKLSAISSLKEDYLAGLLQDEATADGWEIFPKPSYNFNGGTIAIYLNMAGTSVSGDVFRYLNKEGKGRKLRKSKAEMVDEAQISGADIYQGKPVAILSLNELSAMLYAFLHEGKTGEEIENIIKEKIAAQIQRIKLSAEGGEIPKAELGHLPKRFKSKHRVTKSQIDIGKLTKSIKEEIEFCNEKLKQFDKQVAHQKENKYYKPGRVIGNAQKGREAILIADDLKRFMPKEGKENWKGYHHNELQAAIAYFNTMPKVGLEILKPFWIMKNDPIGEIVAAIFNVKPAVNFDEFFKKYYNSRKQIFKRLAVFVDNNIGAGKNPFDNKNIDTAFHKRDFIINDPKTLKDLLADHPVALPRGIFDDKPTFIKGVEFQSNKDRFAQWYVYTKEYKELQNYYGITRSYQKLFEVKKTKNIQIESNIKKLSNDEQFTYFKAKQDSAIRNVIQQDVMLCSIVNALYQDLFNEAVNFKLKDFHISREERISLSEAAKQQSKRSVGDLSENLRNLSTLWNQPITFKNDHFEDVITIKDVGKIRTLLSQPKVQTLFSYELDAVWNRQQLEDELYLKEQSYETLRREEFLKLIQQFEDDIFNSLSSTERPMLLQDGNPNFKHYIVNGILKAKKLPDDEECDWLLNLDESSFEKTTTEQLSKKSKAAQFAFLIIYLRNKFSHNQLPNERLFHFSAALTGIKRETTYSYQILKIFRALIEQIKNNH